MSVVMKSFTGKKPECLKCNVSLDYIDDALALEDVVMLTCACGQELEVTKFDGSYVVRRIEEDESCPPTAS